MEKAEEAIRQLRECRFKSYDHGFFGGSALNYLIDELRNVAFRGHYSPLVGERVVRVAESYTPVVAQRLLENFPFGSNDSRFDFEEYSRLYMLGLRRLGKMAGGFWGTNYTKMTELGYPAEDHYQLVQQAASTGGKLFAGYYCLVLPDFIKVGGDPVSLRISGNVLNYKGRLKVAKPFLCQAPQMVERDNPETFGRFSEAASLAVDELGPEAAAWFIYHMAGLNGKFDYAPEQFLADCQDISERVGGEATGERAAKWFAYGVGYLPFIRTSYERRKRNEDILAEDGWGFGLKEWADEHKNEQTKRQQRAELLTPEHFKTSYLRLLQATGQSGATFLSMVTHSEAPFRAEYPYLDDLIIDFKKSVSRKVFSSSMWFVPKISKDLTDDDTITMLFESITEGVAISGETAVLEALKYTNGCAKRGSKFLGLFYPGRDYSLDDGKLGWEHEADYLV